VGFGAARYFHSQLFIRKLPGERLGAGQKCLGKSLEDVAFATLEYPKNMLANIHVSWLDPKKVRQLTIVGDKRMVVWDDLDNRADQGI